MPVDDSEEALPDAEPLQSPGRDSRVRIIEVDGAVVRVREVLQRYDRRQSPSLVFEGDYSARRVRDFPAHWFTLSDAELYALSLSR